MWDVRYGNARLRSQRDQQRDRKGHCDYPRLSDAGGVTLAAMDATGCAARKWRAAHIRLVPTAEVAIPGGTGSSAASAQTVDEPYALCNKRTERNTCRFRNRLKIRGARLVNPETAYTGRVSGLGREGSCYYDLFVDLFAPACA